LIRRLEQDFSHFGLGLTHLYTNAITPPPEVQQAIDDRARMGVFQDMDKLMQMKAAMAMEKASQADGGAGTGMGMGMGLMMPAMFAQYFAAAKPGDRQGASPVRFSCPECGVSVPTDAKFCPQCGHQQVVFAQCGKCGKNVAPSAKFCARCGQPVDVKPIPKSCAKCGGENLPGSIYCNHCGEKL
jgi:membrane protease subunit (stomatin/prohibitin family)